MIMLNALRAGLPAANLLALPAAYAATMTKADHKVSRGRSERIVRPGFT